MKPLLFAFTPDAGICRSIAASLELEPCEFELRTFPDGETYVRLLEPCNDRDAIIICPLQQPNDKLLPLLLLVETLRDLGIHKVGLVTPYLPYMRQDIRFKPGEGVTSRYFSSILNAHFDWLVTVDPHLHRYSTLDEIYTIPNRVVDAAPVAAKWMAAHIENPLLIGPDEESSQWIQKAAANADVPYEVLLKQRSGDYQVDVSELKNDWQGMTPVLLDDIISTGKTMQQTIVSLKRAGLREPVCIGIHGLFADNAYQELIDAGARAVVTTNCIEHLSNKIDVGAEVAAQIRILMDN